MADVAHMPEGRAGIYVGRVRSVRVSSNACNAKTQWKPQQDVLLYGSAGDGKTKFGCQCMKDCTCNNDKCYCVSMDQRPVPAKTGNDQYVYVLGQEAKVKRATSSSTEFFNAKWYKSKWDDNGGRRKVMAFF